MLLALLGSWRVPELRKRLLFTAGIIALYRAGSYLPVPGVQTDALKNFFGGSNNTILSVLNLFSGGALANLSLFALGIMPYITASIILQLMTVAVPALEQLQKEGEAGYKKITQYTRYLTVGLAALQASGYVFLFHNGSAIGASDLLPDLTVGRFLLIVATLTAGTALLMWMGELVTQRGIGNGMSLLIFASIMTSVVDRDQRVAERRHARAARASDHHPRHPRLRRLRERGAAAHPDPVREAHGRPSDDDRRQHLHAAARQHGRRDPGHLRGRGAVLPADRRAALPVERRALVREVHGAGQLARDDLRVRPRDRVHVLLHRRHVQPGRPGRQPQEERRLHPGRTSWTADGGVPRPRAHAADVRAARCSSA